MTTEFLELSDATSSRLLSQSVKSLLGRSSVELRQEYYLEYNQLTMLFGRASSAWLSAEKKLNEKLYFLDTLRHAVVKSGMCLLPQPPGESPWSVFVEKYQLIHPLFIYDNEGFVVSAAHEVGDDFTECAIKEAIEYVESTFNWQEDHMGYEDGPLHSAGNTFIKLFDDFACEEGNSQRLLAVSHQLYHSYVNSWMIWLQFYGYNFSVYLKNGVYSLLPSMLSSDPISRPATDVTWFQGTAEQVMQLLRKGAEAHNELI